MLKVSYFMSGITSESPATDEIDLVNQVSPFENLAQPDRAKTMNRFIYFFTCYMIALSDSHIAQRHATVRGTAYFDVAQKNITFYFIVHYIILFTYTLIIYLYFCLKFDTV